MNNGDRDLFESCRCCCNRMATITLSPKKLSMALKNGGANLEDRQKLKLLGSDPPLNGGGGVDCFLSLRLPFLESEFHCHIQRTNKGSGSLCLSFEGSIAKKKKNVHDTD